MNIKEQQRTVYTCSDGKEFINEQEARDHEFDISCEFPDIHDKKDLREWLLKKRNFVLDYIGTLYDPEPD